MLGDGTSPLASVSGCPRTYADLTINPGVLTNRASFDPRGDYIDHVDSQSAILERLSFSDYFNDEAWVGSGGDSVHGIQAHLASPMSVDSALNLESPVSDEGLFVQCGVVAGVQEAEAATRSSDSSPGSQSESQVTSNFVKKRPSGSLDSVFKAADLLTQTSPKKRRVAKERPRAPPPSPTLAGCEGQRQATPENNFPSPSPPGSPLTPGSTPTPLSDPESEYFPDPPFTRTRSASRRLARVSSTPELQPVSPALPFRAGDRRMSQNRSAQKKYRDKNRRLLDLVSLVVHLTPAHRVQLRCGCACGHGQNGLPHSPGGHVSPHQAERRVWKKSQA